jgi:PAS domain S-box-containing protein
VLQRTKKEILSELYKKEQRIKDLENKISELHVEVSANEKSQICKLFFENSREGYMLLENGKIMDCNDAAVSMFGYELKQDLIGHIPFDISLTKQAQWSSPKMNDSIYSGFQNKKYTFNWIIQRKDGNELPVEVCITKLLIQTKIIFCAALRDISERIAMQRILEENRQLYQNVFENSHRIMILVEPCHGKIFDANKTACSFYGYSKEQMTNMYISHLSMLNRDIETENSIKAAIEGKKDSFYIRQRASNDEIRFVKVHCNKIKYKTRELICFSVHDFTKMEKVLNALEESEKKYKELFNKANDAIFLYKVDEKGIPHNFMEVNDIACKRLNYSRKELLNMTVKDIKPDNHYSNFYNKINKVDKEGHITFESVHISKYGDKIPVEINSHKFELFGEEVILSIVRDITKRKWIEKFLRESEERNRRLVELLPDPIILQKDGRILYTNQAAIKFLGAENRHSFIGKNVLDFVDIYPGDDITLIMKNLKNEANNFSLFNELRLIRKSDNEVLEVEIASTIFNYSNKQAVLILLRDLRDRRKAEKYIKLFNDAIKYDKLKTQFFANLSHELRTPLNVILGTIQILMMYVNEKPLQDIQECVRNRIKVLKQNCYRLLRLVNNLIDITKIDAGYYELHLQNQNIVSIVEEITLSVAEYIEHKKIKLVFDTNIEERIIACDPDKIERIMLNLLSNAIKFTDPGGSILVNIYDRGSNIIIAVKDTGIGIPKDKIDIIFEHFRQVDKSFTRNHEGSGIGLSLVKSLVEMHGGAITVKSECGKGSEFIIDLPVETLETKDNIIREANKNEPKGDLIEIINIEFSDIYS